MADQDPPYMTQIKAHPFRPIYSAPQRRKTMDLAWLQELAGEAGAVALAGLAVGLVFGWAA